MNLSESIQALVPPGGVFLLSLRSGPPIPVTIPPRAVPLAQLITVILPDGTLSTVWASALTAAPAGIDGPALSVPEAALAPIITPQDPIAPSSAPADPEAPAESPLPSAAPETPENTAEKPAE